MFLSKIWFFLIALAGAVALTIALILPRPAQRALARDSDGQLVVACGVVRIELETYAKSRVELVGQFSRDSGIVGQLDSASGAATIDDKRALDARKVAAELLAKVGGKRPPDFAWLLDRKGRVVTRAKVNEKEFGDVLAGRPLVDDALAGYLRDDLWMIDGSLYFVAASPVIRRDPPVAYAGAVVLGHRVTPELAQELGKPMQVELGFFTNKDDVAISQTVKLDNDELVSERGLASLTSADVRSDCETWGTPDADHPKLHPQLAVRAGKDTYAAVLARLPGEAQARRAYYAVFVKPHETLGLSGTLFGSGATSVKKEDLSFSNFPWILVGAIFLVVLAGGIALMWLEADRPVRRLAADAAQLASGKSERLAEDAHVGRYGSIARQINIHIDKLGRDAKSARTNLDQLLGPAPEGGLGGTIDLLAGALPPRAAAPPPAMPPPSEFRLTDSSVPARSPPRAPSQPSLSRPPTPPSMPTPMPAPPPPLPPTPRAAPVTPAPQIGSAPLRLDDDILGAALPEPSAPVFDPYFKQVYDQFIAVKQSCNEQTSGLTYQKFAEKLVKNRSDLIAKTGCREVRFTVYVKDGKAALKATPVKDE